MNLAPDGSLKQTGLEGIISVEWKGLNKLKCFNSTVQGKDLQEVCSVSFSKENMEGLSERQNRG